MRLRGDIVVVSGGGIWLDCVVRLRRSYDCRNSSTEREICKGISTNALFVRWDYSMT